MFSLIALICHGMDRFIGGYKTQVRKKEPIIALDYGKEELSCNPSLA